MTIEQKDKNAAKFRDLSEPSKISKKTLDTKNGISMKRKHYDTESDFDGKHLFSDVDQKYTQYQIIDRLMARMDAFNRAMSLRGVRKDTGQHLYTEIDKL